MSVANFGPTYNVLRVPNSNGAIAIPVSAVGNAIATIELLQAAGGAPKTMTLPVGVWAIHAEARINLSNAATDFIFGQAFIRSSAGSELFVSNAIIGANFADGHNVVPNLQVNGILVVTAPVTLSWVFDHTGNPAGSSFDGASTSELFATLISA